MNGNIENNYKIAVIADKSTIIGFKLTGAHLIKSIPEPFETEKIFSAINDVIINEEVKFVFITEPLVEACGLQEFEKIRSTLPDYLILTILPDRSGSRPQIGEAHLWKVIQRAIGLKRSM